MNPKPKITTVEAALLLMYIGASDIIGMLLVLVGLDDFGIIDVLTWPVSGFYFRFKGVKGAYDLIGNIAELVPYVGALPVRTIGVLFTIWADRHPKAGAALTQKIGVVQKAAPTISK
jgi:hypothetical protein